MMPRLPHPTHDPVPDLADQAIAEVQAQLGRVDTKASILFGLSLAALTGGATVAAKATLSTPATWVASVAALLVGAALVLLGAAIRPHLGSGDRHGFMRWAAAPHYLALRDLLAADWIDDRRQPAHLLMLARLARRKYLRVRWAVDLLTAAVVFTAATVALTAAGV